MNLHKHKSTTNAIYSTISVGRNIVTDLLCVRLELLASNGVFVLIDEVVYQLYAHTLLADLCDAVPAHHIIRIPAGESNKNLDSCLYIWRKLEEAGAGRTAVLINVGGGVLTDMGGFAAAVYKRGIRTINIPTTLMGMVDAAIGGKTAVDRDGIKNEIGAFHQPEAILVDPSFLATLPAVHLLSGYAEVIKHSLLMGHDAYGRSLGMDPVMDMAMVDSPQVVEIIRENVLFKATVVDQDPHEQGLRRILNLGHTMGHAIESFALAKDKSRALSHGEAVLMGLIGDLYLSHRLLGFDVGHLSRLLSFARMHYSPYTISCGDYESILIYARCDKKNEDRAISTIGLYDVGRYAPSLQITEEQLAESLDFCCEMLGG